jgi:hypothetical protein
MNPIHGGFFHYALGEFFGGVEEIPWEAAGQLLPLKRFDHPNLHRRRINLTEAQANAWAQRRIAKACAGLRRDLLCTAVEIRSAIQRGAFNHREQNCFAWTLSGIPSWYIHEFYTQWRHSMYELARALTVLWEGNHPLSRWLNLWGENPERALPEPDGLTDMERARHRGYPWPWDPLGKDMPILAHDPWVKAGRKRQTEVGGDTLVQDRTTHAAGTAEDDAPGRGSPQTKSSGRAMA